jgi:selenocysteine lyase/cysteine desulfurase
LINAASVDEIAILKNTSEGLSTIAQGLQFEQGDNIVIPDEEFPSNRVVWLALKDQGVEIRLVKIEEADDPERALIDAMDEHTRLLSCSSVQYARGLRLDLNRLGAACKRYDSLFCVDAIQSLGAVAFDVQACQADFVVADGHKWMCAPEGTALFYCRKAVQPSLTLRQYGWHMLKDAFDFAHQHDDIQYADDAQRFESGSPNMMGIAALDASLGLLLDIGIDNIQQLVLSNTEYLFEQLNAMGDIELLTSTQKGKFAGIVTFQKNTADNVSLYKHLQANDVICAYRGEGIRFSPHFHTDKQTMDKALALVSDYITI